MGNTQSNPRVQDAYVWYDEKMRTHFLFCTIDGVEEEGKRISALNAAKVRDGVLTAEQLAEKIYPFLTNGTGKNESEAMQNKADESQITQEKAEPQEAKERTNGRRFMTALNGLVTNYYNNGVRFSAWVADIFTLAWKDDNIGTYKEFAKG